MGIASDEHYKHKFVFKSGSQLIGLQAVKGPRSSKENLERLGVIELDLECLPKKEKDVGEEETSSSHPGQTALIVVMILFVLASIALCVLFHYYMWIPDITFRKLSNSEID